MVAQQTRQGRCVAVHSRHVRVVTDSGADLSANVIAQFGITVVPLIVRFGDETYLDGQLTVEAFWQKIADGPYHPGTSQPPAGVFEEVFDRLVGDGHSVLCLTITGKHSGTFHTASAAGQRFRDRVKVIDSLSLSLGQGFQVLAAAQAAAQGLDLDAVAGAAERVRRRSHLYLVLDTIEYIRRGGRADSLMPVLSRVTRMLRIKPVLTLEEGRLSLYGLSRSYERALAQMEQQIEALESVQGLAVVHVRCRELAEKVAGGLSETLGFPAERILLTETGPLLSTHSGPKVVGVIAVS
jgi:DegV family protein with EDD domain